MSTVQLRGVEKVYPGGYVAASDIDLDVVDGEFFVLVGPSGCGKSTVLRMIAGLEAVTLGDVLIDGVRVNATPTNTRNLSMVFQNSTLYPHLTVAENLGFPLEIAGLGKAAVSERVTEVAGLLGLTKRLGARPRQLSGGERQRVAMGRALVRKPGLLLMDEPMSNLDAKLRTELRAELLALQRRLGITTILVTHDQVEAMALGDRLAVMRRGRVAQSGRPAEIHRRPTDTFVAQFIGTPPMNLLVGRVSCDDAGIALLVGPHRMSIGHASTRWPDLASRVGDVVVVGIRPEAFRRDPNGEFVLSVRFHEQLGSRQWVHAYCDAVVDTTDTQDPAAGTIVASLEGRGDVSLWKPLRLAVDHSQIHLFDRDTGIALRSNPPGTPFRSANCRPGSAVR